MTLEDQIKAVAARVERLEAETFPTAPKVTHLQFTRDYLTRAQAKAWLRIILPARTAVADGTATDFEAELVLADEHFRSARLIDCTDPGYQAAIQIMYALGVFGPVWDAQSGDDPTTDEQEALDHLARLLAGDPVPTAA